MHRNPAKFLLVLLVAGCLPPTPTVPQSDDTQPAVTYGMESIRETMVGRRDAAYQLAAVCDEYARQIEWDGTRPEPVLATTADVAERVAKMCDYAFGDEQVASDEYKAAARKIFDAELEAPGDEATELTPKLRAKAVDMFKTLAYYLRRSK